MFGNLVVYENMNIKNLIQLHSSFGTVMAGFIFTSIIFLLSSINLKEEIKNPTLLTTYRSLIKQVIFISVFSFTGLLYNTILINICSGITASKGQSEQLIFFMAEVLLAFWTLYIASSAYSILVLLEITFIIKNISLNLKYIVVIVFASAGGAIINGLEGLEVYNDKIQPILLAYLIVVFIVTLGAKNFKLKEGILNKFILIITIISTLIYGTMLSYWDSINYWANSLIINNGDIPLLDINNFNFTTLILVEIIILLINLVSCIVFIIHYFTVINTLSDIREESQTIKRVKLSRRKPQKRSNTIG